MMDSLDWTVIETRAPHVSEYFRPLFTANSIPTRRPLVYATTSGSISTDLTWHRSAFAASCVVSSYLALYVPRELLLRFCGREYET